MPRCKQILAFNFPDDMYNTDLYLNYMLAQVGIQVKVGTLISKVHA